MKLSLLFHTVGHLRAKQVAYQLWYRLYKTKFCAVKTPDIKPVKFLPWINKQICSYEEEFDFLNISEKFHSWNDIRHGMLWAYNLNYMDYLLQENMTADGGTRWIERFIVGLPQNRVGLDPYPIALRGINWIKFMSKYGGKLEWNSSLYAQYILLSKRLEYHLLGNHLLEDAYSLFFASIYFSDIKFYKKSSKLLYQELEEQILADGAHYEQSPMYHCILLDRLLDCYNISIHNIRFEGQNKLNLFLKGKAEQMLGHLENICYADETIPLLNDSALNIAPTPKQLKEYAASLQIQWGGNTMGECGYRKMLNGKFEAIVDIGNITATYQPGHSHADTFNYELRIDGKPFIVDTGISTYNKTTRRQGERGTAAHNTVTIGGRDSSEVWGGFRVGKRARVKVLHDTSSIIEASHNGYGNKHVHTRKFLLTDGKFSIEDLVGKRCSAISHIHLAPTVSILSFNENEVVTNLGTIKIDDAIGIEICDGEIAEQYNLLLPTKIIRILFDNKITYSINV